ncbi:MAG: hypothetical protein AAGE94_13770, partial [Acidobacteriota bacterium]
MPTTIVHLIRDDLRRLAIPLGLFAVIVVASGLVRLSGGEMVVSLAQGVLDSVLWFAGLLVAGLFGQAHPIHRHAYWRTRPWSPGTVLVAKLIEVLGFVWLPMAGLQLALLTTFDLPGKPWGVWFGELFVVVAGPLLIAATVGAVTRSVRVLLVVGWAVALVVGIGPILIRGLAGLHGEADAAMSWTVLTVMATAVLILAYAARDRRRTALIGTALLAVWLGPLHGVESPTEVPDVIDPELAVEVLAVRPPGPETRRTRGMSDGIWLCVDIELSDRSADGWVDVTPKATFRGTGGQFDLGHVGSSWGPTPESVAHHRTAATLQFLETRARFAEQRSSRGSLDLELLVESKVTRVLGQGPMEVGTTVAPARHLVSPLDIIEIDTLDAEVEVRMESVGIRHLTNPRFEQDAVHVTLDAESSYVPSVGINNWWGPDPHVRLPFLAQQRVYPGQSFRIGFIPQSTWAADDEDRLSEVPLDELVSQMHWRRSEDVVLDRRTIRKTLDDITLGE